MLQEQYGFSLKLDSPGQIEERVADQELDILSIRESKAQITYRSNNVDNIERADKEELSREIQAFQPEIDSKVNRLL